MLFYAVQFQWEGVSILLVLAEVEHMRVGLDQALPTLPWLDRILDDRRYSGPHTSKLTLLLSLERVPS